MNKPKLHKIAQKLLRHLAEYTDMEEDLKEMLNNYVTNDDPEGNGEYVVEVALAILQRAEIPPEFVGGTDEKS